jgi:hypothetical protein
MSKCKALHFKIMKSASERADLGPTARTVAMYVHNYSVTTCHHPFGTW